MQHDVEYVSPNTTVSDVSHIIFGRNIHGVPVVEDKKIIGYITESDILGAFYPTIQDLVEDPFRAQNYDEIEKKAEEILNYPARKIMSKTVTTAKDDMPIMKAQALMLAKDISRLPIVDDQKRLIGIVSKGDIFRAAVGSKIPFGQEERFYDWIAFHYDFLIDWKKRLGYEVPEITKIFKKHNISKVLDVGSSTGEHSIALAKQGFEVVGIDTSAIICKQAEEKKEKLPSAIQENVHFHGGAYPKIINEIAKDFDAALFLGNALPHVYTTDRNILKDVSTRLKKKSVIILQIANIPKFIKEKNGLEGFNSRDTHSAYERGHSFIGFYTGKNGKKAVYTQAIFDTDGSKWFFKGMSSTEVTVFTKGEIKNMLTALGFTKIMVYGGKFYGPMFEEPFDEKESNYMNIMAVR